MNKYLEKIRLSGDNLKFIACVLMLIDHAAFGLLHYYLTTFYMDILPQTYTKLNNLYYLCKGMSRMAFPIFCFFLVEGFIRTKDIRKYAVRLFIFALISEIPFDLSMYRSYFFMNHQNVMFSLFMGLLMLICLKYIEENFIGISDALRVILLASTTAAFGELASLVHVDYSYKGMLLIAAIYLFRSIKPLQLIICAAISSWSANTPVAFLLLYFYDPSQKPRHKYFFYWFYPVHLIIIYLISTLFQ